MSDFLEAVQPLPAPSGKRTALRELTGRTLGEFVVREHLGQGAMGAVYRAEQAMLGRDAVIKVMLPQGADNEASVRRFLREARFASRLDHPYAAHIYAFGAEQDGLLWIAMELVRGTPLSQYLRDQGRLPVARVVPLMERICEVVQAAHDAGIVHRDLKPANVMVLTRAGRLFPKLLDFGVAKLTTAEDPADAPNAAPAPAAVAPAPDPGDENGPGTVPTPEHQPEMTSGISERSLTAAMTMEITSQETQLGSPAFMAPEQWFNAAKVDGRADIYSLGVMCYQLLAGKLPFVAANLQKLMQMHARGAVPPLPADLQLPQGLNLVLRQAMAKKAESRFASALDFAAALRLASQLQEEVAAVPQLDEELRETCLTSAPRPLAEAVALLESARTPRAAYEAVQAAVKTCVRYVAVLALAARGKAGQGKGDSPQALELLKKLRQGTLTDAEWLALSIELGAAFRGQPSAYPLPEVLVFLTPDPEESGPAALAELHTLTALPVLKPEELPATEDLQSAINRFGRTLRRMSFLFDYALVRGAGQDAERLMGVRRSSSQLGKPRSPGEAELALVDGEGAQILVLSPLAQLMSPSPGAVEEVFLLEGDGRYGAKLAALPLGFERHDEAMWGTLAASLPGLSGTGAAALAEERAPFQGLASFTSSDADHYYGREQEAEAFTNRLRAQSFLAVVGPSGVGKSSFIQAGVIPLLEGTYRAVTVRPGPSPFSALATRLQELGAPAHGLRNELSTRPAALGEHLRALAAKAQQGIVLVVDQFEELITLCADAKERNRYAEALVNAARGVHEPVRIVLTLRDDFLIRVQQVSALRERLAPGLQLLATPAMEDLQRILTEPVRRLGYAFDDPTLPRLMAEQVAQQPGALALLSFTATKLWELRDRRLKLLTRKSYEALGGVGGALAHHAEETLAALSEPEQKLVRETFRHLVSAEGTRAILTRSELLEVLGDPLAGSVVEKLIQARLLTASESATGEDRIEVIHETLLISWPRLVKWQREDAENARLRDQLRAAARQWEERSRSKGVLWRAEALMEYRLWRLRYQGGLTSSEEAFARASLAEEQRGKRIRRGFLVSAFVVLVAVLVVVSLSELRAVRSNHEAHAALARLHVEQGRRSFLDGSALQGLVFLAKAYSEGVDTPALHYLLGRVKDAASGQRGTMMGHTGKLYDAHFSPDGKQVITCSDDHTAKIWDAQSAKVRLTLPMPGFVYACDFSADGKHAAAAGNNGAARIFSTADGALELELKGHAGPVYTISFSPNGTQILTGGSDKTARLWSARTGGLQHTLAGTDELSLATFSPDGSRVAVAVGLFAGEFKSSPELSIWDAHSGEKVFTLAGHKSSVLDVAFSPDGHRLLSASGDHTARVWSLDNGTLLHELKGARGRVRAAAWSLKGDLLATSGEDKTVQVWDARSGDRIEELAGHTSPVRSVAFSPDGTRLASAGRDTSVMLWNVAAGTLISKFSGHLDSVATVHFSPDGTRVVSASRDFTARLWDAEAHRQLFSGEIGEPSSWAQYVGGGRILVSGSETHLHLFDGQGRPLPTVDLPGANTSFPTFDREFRTAAVPGPPNSIHAEVWDLATKKRTVKLLGHTSPVDMAVLSADGKDVLTAGEDQRIVLFDAATGEQRWTLALEEQPQTADFSPDKRFIVVGFTSNPEVRLYDRVTGHLEKTLLGHTLGVFAVAFSPDGKLLASGGGDATIRLWSLPDGKPLHTMYGHEGNLNSLAFRGDSALLVSAATDQTARVWSVEDGTLLDTLDLGEIPISAAFSPDGNQLLTAGTAGAFHVWNARPDGDRPADINAYADCHSPFRLEGERVMATAAHACAEPAPSR